MVQCGIESESTNICGTGFNTSALKFQCVTELQMGVRNIGIQLERCSVGVFGLCQVP